MADDRAPTHAKLRVPGWLWGGSPGGYLGAAGFRWTAPANGNDVWTIRTDESYLRQPASFLTTYEVAGANVRKQRWELLEGQRVAGQTKAERWVLSEVDKRSQALERADLVGLVNFIRLHGTVAASEDLSSAVQDAHRALQQMRVDDSGDPAFPASGVHVIFRSERLLHRLKLPQLLLRLEGDPSLGDPSEISRLAAGLEDGRAAFASSEQMLNGIYLMETYLGPLWGAISPALWAIPVPRTFGSIVYTLGRPVSGTGTGDAPELLALLNLSGGGVGDKASRPLPQFGDLATTSALAWWTHSLNGMFKVLSDPAVFTNSQGVYRPMKHLQALLTVEQLFRRVASIQALHRDENARQVLLFTVLDTLERLTGRSIDTCCDAVLASERLGNVEASMPSAAAEILLPNARRGVAALQELQDGFFIAIGAKQASVDLGGQRGPVPLNKAAALYVKLRRDATHGHGSKRAAQATATNALLIQHDGRMPHDLGHLGYLYLLELLSNPANLRKKLFASGSD